MNLQYGSRPLYAPAGKVYMFGDVHNEADKLRDVLEQVEPLVTKDDHIVFCGDLVDRGTQAADTIEELVDLALRRPDQTFFVRGNHDWMLENYLVTGNFEWMTYLGITLGSFRDEWQLPDITPGTIAQALLDKGFKEIVSRTVPYYETEELVVTHAPLEPMTCQMLGIETYEKAWTNRANNPNFRFFLERLEGGILWDFAEEEVDIPEIKKFRVCGHQPGNHKVPRLFHNRAFIDSGCGKGKRPLTCMVYPEMQFWQSR